VIPDELEGRVFDVFDFPPLREERSIICLRNLADGGGALSFVARSFAPFRWETLIARS